MQPGDTRQIKGRGATASPANPFKKFHLEVDPEWLEEMAHDPDAVSLFRRVQGSAGWDVGSFSSS
jgi:hypothetical protein